MLADRGFGLREFGVMHILLFLLQYWHVFAGREPRVAPASIQGGPGAEYTRRMTRHVEHLQEVRTRYQILWACFVASAVAAIGLAALALAWGCAWTWVAVPVAVLAWTGHSLTRHAGVHNRLETVVRFYERGLERLSHEWQGCGVIGEGYSSGKHLYSADLDVFGRGSLFEMLCSARTGIGRARLAGWLLHAASPDEILARQEAVAELRGVLNLQEDWAATGNSDPTHVNSSGLEEWATAPAVGFSSSLRAGALVLPVALLVIATMARVGLVAHWPVALGVVVVLEALVAAPAFKRAQSVADDVVLPAFELGIIAPLLERFRRERFHSPLLLRLQSQVASHAGTSSREIARLRLWAWLLDLRRSEYFAAILSVLLWKTNFAIAVERWRARNRAQLSAWLEVIGQFEALMSLARYSYENPDHVFPHFRLAGPAFFQAEDLGHPLLSSEKCTRCDVSLDSEAHSLMIVSGSNMSGKSTLLRSIGLNTVLAMAGAPVRASRLEMSPLQLGCSIALHDSLAEGKSRFQVEVERLKDIVTVAGRDNVLVLLDEVLGGTNSTDRRFGTKAVVGRLLHSGALCVITTHDLALTNLATDFGGRGMNVHFEETYENGQMCFDYTLRAGVLTRSNGANVIAALGLLQEDGCGILGGMSSE